MPEDMAFASTWAAALAATAKGALDDLKAGLEVHMLIRPALNGLAGQAYLNHGAQG
jgi:hypothetical protein